MKDIFKFFFFFFNYKSYYTQKRGPLILPRNVPASLYLYSKLELLTGVDCCCFFVPGRARNLPTHSPAWAGSARDYTGAAVANIWILQMCIQAAAMMRAEFESLAQDVYTESFEECLLVCVCVCMCELQRRCMPDREVSDCLFLSGDAHV